MVYLAVLRLHQFCFRPLENPKRLSSDEVSSRGDGRFELECCLMKKTFSLRSEVHRPDRVVESVKAEINKYLARERRKTLPEGADVWDFDCKCGVSAETAETVFVGELGKSVDAVFATDSEKVYVHILA